MTTDFRRKIAGRETELMTRSDLAEFKLELEAQLSNRKSQLLGATADEKNEYDSWRNSVVCIIKNIDKEMVRRRGVATAQSLADPTAAESTKARIVIALLAMTIMGQDQDNYDIEDFTPSELEEAAERAIRAATICHTAVWRVLDKAKKQ
jgi:hypothetical protein